MKSREETRQKLLDDMESFIAEFGIDEFEDLVDEARLSDVDELAGDFDDDDGPEDEEEEENKCF